MRSTRRAGGNNVFIASMLDNEVGQTVMMCNTVNGGDECIDTGNGGGYEEHAHHGTITR